MNKTIAWDFQSQRRNNTRERIDENKRKATKEKHVRAEYRNFHDNGIYQLVRILVVGWKIRHRPTLANDEINYAQLAKDVVTKVVPFAA